MNHTNCVSIEFIVACDIDGILVMDAGIDSLTDEGIPGSDAVATPVNCPRFLYQGLRESGLSNN